MSDAVIGLVGALVGGALTSGATLVPEWWKYRAAKRSEEADARTTRQAEQSQLLRVQRLLAEELLTNRDTFLTAMKAVERVEERLNGPAGQDPDVIEAMARVKDRFASKQWDALKSELATAPTEEWLAVQTPYRSAEQVIGDFESTHEVDSEHLGEVFDETRRAIDALGQELHVAPLEVRVILRRLPG